MLFTVELYLWKSTDVFWNMTEDNNLEDMLSFTSLNWNGFSSSYAGDPQPQ